MLTDLATKKALVSVQFQDKTAHTLTRPLTRARNKYGFLFIFGPGPGGSEGPREAPQKTTIGVWVTFGALPEAPGTNHEPNSKTYEPKRID